MSIQQVNTNQKYNKLLSWSKLITLTGGAQAIVQGISLFSGILVIRLLSTQEYALYTLANTMLGTMTLLADGGITTGVMSQSGKVWQDRDKLGVIIKTGFHLRTNFAFYSLIVSSPVLLYLLLHQGANWATSILILMALILALIANISDSLLEIVPKLHQDIRPLQLNQISVSLGRLALTSLTLLIFPWSYIALIANGLPRIVGNFHLKRVSNKYITHSDKIDENVKSKILLIVRRVLPENIYYCLSGQVNIWLASFFGQAMALASLGAISRMGVVVNIFSIIINILFVPRFARLPDNKKILLKYIIGILIIVAVVSLLTIGFVNIFSKQILWVFGEPYKNLEPELVIYSINSCVFLLLGCFYSLNMSRGWVISPIIYICTSLLVTAGAAIVINLSTVTGLLYFTITISASQAILLIAYSFYNIHKNI